MNVICAVKSFLGVRKPDKSGQTMIEYVIVATVMLLVLVMLAFLLYALRQNGNRVLDLVASDCP